MGFGGGQLGLDGNGLVRRLGVSGRFLPIRGIGSPLRANQPDGPHLHGLPRHRQPDGVAALGQRHRLPPEGGGKPGGQGLLPRDLLLLGGHLIAAVVGGKPGSRTDIPPGAGKLQMLGPASSALDGDIRFGAGGSALCRRVVDFQHIRPVLRRLGLKHGAFPFPQLLGRGGVRRPGGKPRAQQGQSGDEAKKTLGFSHNGLLLTRPGRWFRCCG